MKSGGTNPYLFIFTPDRGKINKGEFNSSLMNSSCFLFCNLAGSFGSLTGRDYSQHCLKPSSGGGEVFPGRAGADTCTEVPAFRLRRGDLTCLVAVLQISALELRV